MKSRSQTSTISGPGATAQAAMLVSRCCHSVSLLASTSPPTQTVTAEPCARRSLATCVVYDENSQYRSPWCLLGSAGHEQCPSYTSEDRTKVSCWLRSG